MHQAYGVCSTVYPPAWHPRSQPAVQRLLRTFPCSSWKAQIFFCADFAFLSQLDNHDQQRQLWKPDKGGPPSSPVCRWNGKELGDCRPMYKHGPSLSSALLSTGLPQTYFISCLDVFKASCTISASSLCWPGLTEMLCASTGTLRVMRLRA